LSQAGFLLAKNQRHPGQGDDVTWVKHTLVDALLIDKRTPLGVQVEEDIAAFDEA
jgi:hypothetical protein